MGLSFSSFLQFFKHLLIFFILIACSQINEKDKHWYAKLSGKWETVSFDAGFVHAATKIPYAEPFHIPYYYIQPRYSLELKDESSFKIKTEKKLISGEYIIKNDTLIFSTEGKEFLSGRLLDVRNDSLFMFFETARFFTVEKDSAWIITGDKILVTMKKVNANTK